MMKIEKRYSAKQIYELWLLPFSTRKISLLMNEGRLEAIDLNRGWKYKKLASTEKQIENFLNAVE